MSTLPPGFVEYVTVEEVVGELNLEFDKTTERYMLYNVKILPITIARAVSYANVYMNSVTGDVTGNTKQFARAKILAGQIASLRTAIVSAGGWVKGASDYSFSGLSASIGSAARDALQKLAETKKKEIDDMLLMVQGQTILEEVDQSTRDFYSRGLGSDYVI